MTAINTEVQAPSGSNSKIKNFFANNWLTLVLIVVLGVGAYFGIKYLTDLSSKNEAIQQLIDAHQATLAAREADIARLTASYNAQTEAIGKLNIKYEQTVAQLRTDLQTQIDAIKRTRAQRVQTLTNNPSTVSAAFAERYGLTLPGTTP